MDLLHAEIAKKRKQLGGAEGGGKRRWVRTADLQRQRRDEIEAAAKGKAPAAKPNRPAEAPEAKEAEAEAEVAARVSARVNALEGLDTSEVVKRLRAAGEPATLFGEDAAARVARLAALEARATVDDDLRLTGGHELTETTATTKPVDGADASDDEAPAVEDAVDDDDHATIRRWVRARLKEWEATLEKRTDAAKRGPQGRVETRTYKQTKDYVRPLVKLCKRRSLDLSMRTSLTEIVGHCDAGEFVKANNAYILIAIGNAAWPIGVTSVGIHTRVGRERVEQKNVAHVMNDECARKYLTSMKRLMKVAQDSRDDVAPSKKVL
mmetsp:Transcript_12628/g.38895  ORF Transcript_12628/g.38895 Transcript_12628/m.38895 type:complete len:323 (+) Transcript_12628:77-1045(+)